MSQTKAQLTQLHAQGQQAGMQKQTLPSGDVCYVSKALLELLKTHPNAAAIKAELGL